MKNRNILYGFIMLLVILLATPYADAKILVVSPHSDDDILIASGIEYRALASGETVTVVHMTNGDFNGIADGNTRQMESVNAHAYMGMSENQLIFLGYPDNYLQTLYTSYTLSTQTYTTPNNQSVTYGSRGLNHTDYHTYKFGSPANYNSYNILKDLEAILTDYKPDHIFTTSQWDQHPDHATTYLLLKQAILVVNGIDPTYVPTLHSTLVWTTGNISVRTSWPNALDPTAYFLEIPGLDAQSQSNLNWNDRESIDVPLLLQSPYYVFNPKYLAISAEVSQVSDPILGPFLYAFVHKDEFFWTENPVGGNQPPVPNAGTDQAVSEGAAVSLNGGGSSDPDSDPLSFKWTQTGGKTATLSNPTVSIPSFTAPTGLTHDETMTFELVVSDGTFTSVPDAVLVKTTATNPYPNIAPFAAVTASTEASGQPATAAIDGVIDGFQGPVGDVTKEWSTNNGETIGAWIQLNWSEAYTVDRVILYDRPNSSDQIVQATLTFSDSSTITVGPLGNNAEPTEFIFPAKVTTSLKMTVDQVSATTANIGLAEIEVFGESQGSNNSTTTLSSSPTSTYGNSVSFTATVSGAGTPTGTVYFKEGTKVLGSATIASGSAIWNAPAFTFTVGTHNVTAWYSGDSNFKTSFSTAFALTVNKANQAALTAIVTPSTVVYGNTAALTSSGGNGAGAVTYSVGASTGCLVSGATLTTLTVTDASGTCSVTATKAADVNYNLATSSAAAVTLQKADQTITFGALAIKAVGDANYSPGATASSTLAVSYTSSNLSVATIVGVNIHIVSAGTTTITALQAGNTNYNAAVPVTQGLTVAPSGQTITVSQHAPASAAYNSTFNVVSTASSSLPVAITTSGGCSGSGSGSATITMTSGTTTCTVNYNQAGSADFGAATQVSETTTAQMINQATLTAVVTPATVAYGSTAALSAAGGSGTGAVTYSAGASTGCSVAGSTLSVTSVNGACSVTASKAADTNYNAATSLAVTVTLQKAAQTITFNTPTVKDINDAPFALNATGGSSGNAVTFVVASGPGTIAGTTLTITGLGSIVITASQAGDSNFNAAADVQKTITVLLIGDMDGDNIVNIADALKVLRIAAGLDVQTASDLAHGDVAPLVIGVRTPDGKIDLADVVAILRKAAGLPSW